MPWGERGAEEEPHPPLLTAVLCHVPDVDTCELQRVGSFLGASTGPAVVASASDIIVWRFDSPIFFANAQVPPPSVRGCPPPAAASRGAAHCRSRWGSPANSVASAACGWDAARGRGSRGDLVAEVDGAAQARGRACV